MAPTPDIFDLSDRAVDALAALDPIYATNMGIAGFDDQWTDLSPAGMAAQREFFAQLLADARRCPTPDRRSDVAAKVLVAECERTIAEIDAGDWQLDLNNIVSPWQSIRTVFDVSPMVTAADWSAITTRLETIDHALANYRTALEAGQANARTPARRQVETAIEQGRQAAGDGSSFDTLLQFFDDARPTGGDRDRLVTAINHAKKSYGEMTDWFESVYLPDASEVDGVGLERYVRSAAQFLGETIDPAATYAWGWSEIARISDQLSDVCGRIDPDRSIEEVLELLMTDPDRAAHDVEEFIALMQARQEQALDQLAGTHFDVDERIRTIEVKVAPPGGAAAPYYTGPSEDFSRPGRVWYPVDDREQFPLFEEITTAYHEGFPGHHLQVGWQNAMGDDLSRYHRNLVWYSGSGEGWALYAEHLMGELGFFEKPDYEVGLLMSQMFRSCRIVIDIGLHLGLTIPADAPFHPGEAWTFELAVEMMRTVAHQPEAMATSEIIRYLGWPGQAISYKLGERAILDLRAEMEARAAAAAKDFDRKQFHAEVLSVGSIGLDLMRELVRSA